MDQQALDLLKESIGHFKDWSNYLLVTTTGVLAWIAAGKPQKTARGRWARNVSLVLFAVSIVFAIFTLALIPLVTEKLAAGTSIFDTPVSFHWLYMWGPLSEGWTLKYVCWPQHISFLLGIVAFTVGSLESKPSR